MSVIKRVLKGALIWSAAMLAMYLIFSPIYPTGSEAPIFISFFVFLFPILCAVRFSKLKPKAVKKPISPSRAKKQQAHQQAKSAPPSSDSMDYIDTMEGHDFEEFVASLLRKLGYERVKVTPGSGDQGVDIIAVKGDKKYAIQCKRYSHKLGNKPVQEVYAGKTIYGCNIAVVLTNNYFTEGAKEAACAVGVELWDRDTLKRMITYAEFKDGK